MVDEWTRKVKKSFKLKLQKQNIIIVIILELFTGSFWDNENTKGSVFSLDKAQLRV